MWKRALISVSDKTGLIEFVKPLVQKGLEVVSTGGTAEYLRSHGISVTDVSEVTHFPEVLDGRVKTLHPNVHMGLLGRPDEGSHVEAMKKFSVKFFDLVVVNLYPFEKAFHEGAVGRALIEKIDVGGPTMLRAAAKNFEFITVVVDPQDYKNLSGGSELTTRQKLAGKVFAHLSAYDSLISCALNPELETPKTWAGRQVQTLRYGENPHQKASWFQSIESKNGLHKAEILQGKELSYNNLLDLDAALTLCGKFEPAAAVAVKHNNPCGVAEGKDPLQVLQKALRADSVSVFGGIVAINRPVSKAMAEELGQVFLECVVAPSFEPEAKNILEKKKNLRLLALSDWQLQEKLELRSVFGGYLLQERDSLVSSPEQWKFFGDKPDDEILKDFQFGEKVCAALKSNAIAVVGDRQTLGLGMGQVNRVDAVKQALDRFKKFHPGRQGVLISDAFFPFSDSIDEIAGAGIQWVLQPGGSLRDDEVIQRAKDLKVNLVLTGFRHFKH